MGGVGSGDYYRWSKKTTTEQVKRIDIRYMRRRGLLAPTTTGRLSWSCGGEPIGNIQYICYSDYMQLSFRYKEYGSDWKPVEQHIPFDRTPCNYGGERLWFLCPRCNRRVAVLYGYDVYFFCRHCYQIPYASQHDGETERIINQKRELAERIFDFYKYGEGYGKKKGMHWKTFNRLHARYEALEQECNRSMLKFLNP